MPTLKDAREVKEVILPKSQITVKIKDGLIAADVAAISKVNNEAEQSFTILLKLIVGWDATDEAGTPLPVNLENLQLLLIEDLQALNNSLSFVQDFLAKAKPQDTK